LISFSTHLEDRGFDALSADVWGEFVGGVLSALLAAEKSLKAEKAWQEFCGAAGAFGKPRKSGPHSAKSIPTEEGISGELADRMNDFLRQTDDDHVLRKWHVSFDCEGRVRSGKRKGKHASRTDIRARGQKPDGPEFVLEAKIVDSQGEIRSRLLGPKGLGCFTSNEPYTTANVAGLLAYTVRGESEEWHTRIENGYIELPPISSDLVRVTIDPTNFIALCVPVSRLTATEPILILNLVLRFCTNPV
jgi:hypothetical protein